MDNAEADYKRMHRLYEQKLIAEQQRDAHGRPTVAAERYRAAQERLDMVKEGPRQEEIQRAEADVQQARGALLRRAPASSRSSAAAAAGHARANIRRDRAALGWLRRSWATRCSGAPRPGWS
jgi:hypothetical protein